VTTTDFPGAHGRPVQYNRGCRCQQCTAANTSKQKAARTRRSATRKSADQAGHGSVSTYRNHGCRCQHCTKANSDMCAAYREGRNNR
jgi:hypothetical protein